MAVTFEHDAALAYTGGVASALARAFGNLIDNAIKYSPDNTCVACALTRQNTFWHIELTDQGRGIDPNNLANVFVPFNRINENAPGNPGGNGLGLSFVKAVIEGHGGTITVPARQNENGRTTWGGRRGK